MIFLYINYLVLFSMIDIYFVINDNEDTMGSDYWDKEGTISHML